MMDMKVETFDMSELDGKQVTLRYVVTPEGRALGAQLDGKLYLLWQEITPESFLRNMQPKIPVKWTP